MKMNQLLSAAGIFLGLTLAGCSQNVDPLDLMGNSIPTLNSITASSGAINSYIQSPFTATNPYWVFSSGFGTFAGNYTSPAPGLVSEIGTASLAGVQGYFVTIVHSGRIATRLYGLQTVNLRTGDYVLAGQVIASYYISSPIGFQVLLDGTPVCPFSYISTQFRTSLYSYNTSQLCQ